MRTQQKRFLILLGIGLAFLVFITSASVVQPLFGYTQKLLIPIQRFFYDTSVQDATGNTEKTPEQLRTYILQLEKQLSQLEQQLVTASTASRECRDLKASLSFISHLEKRTGVSATVVARGVDADPSLIMIDQGASAGMIEGAPVITPEGAFIGSVYKVTPVLSFVRLITHPHAAVGVARQSDGMLVGMVQGRFGLSAELSLVPRESNVRVGDLLYTAGLDERTPSGLLVGTVETIEEEKNTQFFKGFVRVRFSPETLHIVTVLVPKQ